MNNLHVKKGDEVIIISGRDKGKKGKVLEVSPKEKKVIIENRNIVTKHIKPRNAKPGGIVKAEGAIYACKVMPYCKKCDKGVRTGSEIKGDKKIRVCKGCGATL